eukprot:TRINITY_DN9453_c0_g1_i12.p1 TRINITY_DN9453_c0_g1~~TRINITY_DN9453_c0_g1_i12.p1  ORF type:complete len:133 (-),score=30.95 TRINITY_DN9453_c0_g1_i12:179-577(-)
MIQLYYFFFSSRRRHTRQESVSWARRCVQETALNKQDLPGAKKAADFEDELTAEIERIKISRRAIRDDSEASSEDFLKEESKRFNAGDYGISFCEVSVNRGEIESVQKFINDQFFQGQMTSFFVIYMFTIKF